MHEHKFIGVGLPTEVAYFYKRNPGDETEHDDTSSDAPEPAFIIDTAVEDEANNITHGVKVSFGEVCGLSPSICFASLGPPLCHRCSMLTAMVACHLHLWVTYVLMGGAQREIN